MKQCQTDMITKTDFVFIFTCITITYSYFYNFLLSVIIIMTFQSKELYLHLFIIYGLHLYMYIWIHIDLLGTLSSMNQIWSKSIRKCYWCVICAISNVLMIRKGYTLWNSCVYNALSVSNIKYDRPGNILYVNWH